MSDQGLDWYGNLSLFAAFPYPLPRTLQFVPRHLQGFKGEKSVTRPQSANPWKSCWLLLGKKRGKSSVLAAKPGEGISLQLLLPTLPRLPTPFPTTRRHVSAALFRASRVTMSILPIGISVPRGDFEIPLAPPPKRKKEKKNCFSFNLRGDGSTAGQTAPEP